MIYIDENGFDKQHYKFDYVRREFLGEVRTLVFDVTPLAKAGKGRFPGRIWVEDQDFHIVRFNGAYNGSSRTNYYFHFDSWRVNAGPNLWLPAFIYSEESDLNYALSKRLSFKAQTRLWGYNLGHSAQEQELSKILIESQRRLKIRPPRRMTSTRCRRNAIGTARRKTTLSTGWSGWACSRPKAKWIRFSRPL